MKLRDILQQATNERWAVGHFNISNAEQLRAIAEAMKAKKAYAMIGVSEGERKHIGLLEAVALVRATGEEFGLPLFLNADHSKTVESACAAADAGFDSIHIDASEHPYEKNIEMTRAVVEYAKKISPDISVEGEIGFVPGESKVSDKEITIDESLYTNPETVADFVEKTGVDRLAIFVGNVHGLHKAEPKLDVERIRLIRQKISPGIALVLHAGSGIPDEDIRRAVEAGIANVHINTEIRVAFTDALRKELAENPTETTPYKYTDQPMEAVREIVEKKMIVFGGDNKLQ
jgi:ketose-bisphosphate aldolase